jgi:tRNA1(Val) A37 N6-methylase TrmN6
VPADRPDVWPAAGEDLCYLAGDWRILQRVRGHRWSLDDLVTAWFAAECAATQPPKGIADLGCGIGAVLLLLAWRFPGARCVGIETQPVSAALARRSVAWNGAADRCEVRVGDLRDPQFVAPDGPFDLVTGTPPYLPLGTASEPTSSQQAFCHLERRGGIEAYCAAAVRLLAPQAPFVVCHSDPPRTHVAALTAGLAVECERPVIPRAGKAPLFHVFALRAAAAAHAPVRLPPLVVRDACGQRSAEFRALRAAMGMPP